MDLSLYREMAELEDTFWWFVGKRRIVSHMIGRYAEPGARVCDIGCGTGGLLRSLKDRYKVLGVDSEAYARELCAESGVRVVPGSLPDDIPVEDGSQDVVVLSDVLEHVENDTDSVPAVARLLAPGGVMVCTVPAHPWMWTKRDEHHHHFRRYTKRAYRDLFREVPLEPLRMSYYNTVLLPPMAAVRLGRKLLGRDDEGPDITLPPAPINTALRASFESEKHVLARMPIPVGASLISVHRRV